MPFNLLLLPLLSGYLFTHLTYCTRFRAYGHSSYRLLFNSALYGLAFGFVSHLGTRLCVNLISFQPFQYVLGLWKILAPWPFSGSALGSLAVAYFAARVANRMWDRTTSSEKAIKDHGDSLMKLLHSAQKEKKTVMLTLSDRKVYVGYVVLDLNLKPEMPYVSLLPTASGYRDTDSLRVHLTVSYGDIYGQIAGGLRNDVVIEDFQVLVPTAMIVSARIFSLKVYREYFGARSDESSEREKNEESNSSGRKQEKARKKPRRQGSVPAEEIKA